MEDEDQSVRLKANYVISAFGSGLTDENGATVLSGRLLCYLLLFICCCCSGEGFGACSAEQVAAP